LLPKPYTRQDLASAVSLAMAQANSAASTESGSDSSL